MHVFDSSLYYPIYDNISGANLLLDDKDNVKLADFGLALSITLKDNVTCSSQQTNKKPKFAGTFLYAAPEVQSNFTGKLVRYGRAADVW
jgi:serine/threonine protein kinase